MRHLIVFAGYAPCLAATINLRQAGMLHGVQPGKVAGPPGDAFELVYDKVGRRLNRGGGSGRGRGRVALEVYLPLVLWAELAESAECCWAGGWCQALGVSCGTAETGEGQGRYWQACHIRAPRAQAVATCCHHPPAAATRAMLPPVLCCAPPRLHPPRSRTRCARS